MEPDALITLWMVLFVVYLTLATCIYLVFLIINFFLMVGYMISQCGCCITKAPTLPKWINSFMLRFKTAVLGLSLGCTGILGLLVGTAAFTGTSEGALIFTRISGLLSTLGFAFLVTVPFYPQWTLMILANAVDQSPTPFLLSFFIALYRGHTGLLKERLLLKTQALEKRYHVDARGPPPALPATYLALLAFLQPELQRGIEELQKVTEGAFTDKQRLIEWVRHPETEIPAVSNEALVDVFTERWEQFSTSEVSPGALNTESLQIETRRRRREQRRMLARI